MSSNQKQRRIGGKFAPNTPAKTPEFAPVLARLEDPGGRKADDGKLPWDLLPWDAVEEVVKVLQYGAAKYEPRNWEKGIDTTRLFAAMIRHATAWFHGQNRDPESNERHLAHAACCILFLLAQEKRGLFEFDTRPVLSNDIPF
jgi:hypothetical protein